MTNTDNKVTGKRVRTRYEMADYRGEKIMCWGTPALRSAFPKCSPPKDEPYGYIAWHEWADKKGKTHYQVRCREHGLLHNWVLRKKDRKQ